MNTNNQSGGILIMTIIFVMMLTVMFISLSGMTNTQYRQGGLAAQDETAFQIAEAGLNYARWRLAHEPDNLDPETREVTDQLKGVIGSYSLTFVPPPTGSTVVKISSVGHTATSPDREITIDASYGKPSFAKYASFTNDDVWYTSTISGAVHSNGGIRMDGVSDSLMTSAKETYVCQEIHGCTNETKPGVWGSGSNNAFWQYPVATVDYSGLTSDLLSMKEAAQAAGTYYGPSSGYGYSLQFGADNRYRVYTVTAKTAPVDSYASDTGWQNRSDDVATQTVLHGYRAVPTNAILFFEDTLWIRGTVESRVTVAAGRFPDIPSTNADIIPNGQLTYSGVYDGTRALGVIAQGNVLLPLTSAPYTLTLDGSYVAQHGRFGRRYYLTGQASNMRGTLTRFGMIASNLVPVTGWSDGTSIISGYRNNTSYYDPNILYAPPPFFPTSGSYEILSWSKGE